MIRPSPFIWTPTQAINHQVDFRGILRDGPARREDGVNRWFMFRQCFDINGNLPDIAIADIFVDGRYSLSVNGHYVGRGPARTNPYYARYDSHDIAGLLVSGQNTIAILIHVYGVDTSWYQRAVNYWQTAFGDGGLYFHLHSGENEFNEDDGSLNIIADTDWRCLQSHAWTQDTPKIGWGQGFIEEHDARLVPEGWQDPGFDDSRWDKAQVLVTGGESTDVDKGFHATQPFPTLIPRDMPLLVEAPRSPARIVTSFGLVSDDSLMIDRRIFDEQITDLPADAITSPEALLGNDDKVTLVRTSPGIDICILIEFNEIHAGYPNIELIAEGGEIIEMAVSETIPGEYTNGLPDKPRLTRETFMDCAHLFRYIARKGPQRFEKFEWTAIKYAQLVIRNAPDGIQIRHIGSTYTVYPVEQQGAFTCSDNFLNRLWQVGSYTIEQCSHDAWEDCPGREKRQWLGDGTVRYLASFATFGTSTLPLDRNYLLQCQESQRTDGLLQMFAPGDHHYQGMIIPDYSLYWVLTVWDYFLHTGDLDTVVKVFPTVEKVLAWFQRQQDSNGLLADLPYWHFIEWANTIRSGESATVNAMYAAALSCASKLAHHLRYASAAERYSEQKDRIAKALNKRHWNGQVGLYVDSVDPLTGTQAEGLSQHANAAMILWDIAPRDRWGKIVQAITDRNRLRLSSVFPVTQGDPDFDRSKHIVKANTFFAHFVYTAIAKANHFDLALAHIREHYHDMITKNAETLWESIEPTASLCHAFSATPVFQLSANCLGIKPLEPGFAMFELHIQPGDLTSAEGIYPSPAGGIHVSWEIQNSTMEVHIRVPAATRCTTIVPTGFEVIKAPLELQPGSHRLDYKRITRS